MTQPLYQRIEFCRNAEALWGKLASKRYDWLGVHPDGKFVVGSPPVQRLSGSVESNFYIGDVQEGEHGFRIEGPLGQKADQWFATEEEAKAAFARFIEEKPSHDAPELLRVRRIESGSMVEEKFVVRRPTTYRGMRQRS